VTTTFQVRRATVAEADVIARHRARMFLEMGLLPQPLYEGMLTESKRYLAQTMLTEEYIGWLCAAADAPREIVGGAGVLQRRVPPHPLSSGGGLAKGRQGVILNVYTEPAWRRRGVAKLLMRHILAWAGDSGLETLVLHASAEGRPLYERLGFVTSNEMRYAGAWHSVADGCPRKDARTGHNGAPDESGSR
jgi:GNAT superfamily N-acetyltransferase